MCSAFLRKNMHVPTICVSEPLRIITLILFSVLFIANPCAAQKDSCLFQDYSSRPTEEIATAIKNDLASKNPARRDGTLMFLSVLINDGKKSQKGNETILRLAGDRETVNIASDIVEDRLAGWYEERESTQEKSMPLYYPLIHLLSVSRSKTAVYTLSMALPAVGFDAFFMKSLFSSGQVLTAVLYKLTTIENKLCCLYPGRDLICDMQAIDFRLSMLRMYLESAGDKDPGIPVNDVEMKKFVSGCLEFGDGNKGRIIRTRALEMACILIKAGNEDLRPAVNRIAESDPCYLYRAGPAEGNCLPQYGINSKYYPVREKAVKELSRLNR
jgi:hypothetical protein